MSNFFLELVSPDKNYFVGNVDMVVLPGEEGDFSVLFDHAPIITFLRPGRVLIIEETGKEHLFFVASDKLIIFQFIIKFFECIK